MGKTKISREVTDRDINRLENVVVAYNTVFLMSSIFIVLIASTAKEIFFDFTRTWSPSLVLLTVGSFIVLVAILGYAGVEKKSSSLISLYTMLLIFIFVMEISAGLGILSFRKEIRSTVSAKMKEKVIAYPTDLMTANLVDFFQLELQCCGVNNYKDWNEILESTYQTECTIGEISLPRSCCSHYNYSTPLSVNPRGCLPAVNAMLHRTSLSLTAAILAICTIQILGAYFSYALGASLSKYKIQKALNSANLPPPYEVGIPMNHNEKSGYF